MHVIKGAKEGKLVIVFLQPEVCNARNLSNLYKYIVIFIFFIISTLVFRVALAMPLADGDVTTLKGNYGSSRNIEMTINRQGNSLSGYYISEESPDSAPFQGRIEGEGKIVLFEVNNGSYYGNFKGQFKGDQLVGQWELVGVDQPLKFFLVIVKKSKVLNGDNLNTVQFANTQSFAHASSPIQNRPIKTDGGLENETNETPAQLKPTNDKSSSNLEYVLISLISTVLVGATLGANNKIIVFRNYNDLAITFAAGLFAVISIFTKLGTEGESILYAFFALLSALTFLWLILRTIKDNHNPIWMVVALITKVTLSILFIVNLIDFVTPSGKTARDRASSRRFSFISLLLIAPITFALVKEKTGIFSPRAILGNRF